MDKPQPVSRVELRGRVLKTTRHAVLFRTDFQQQLPDGVPSEIRGQSFWFQQRLCRLRSHYQDGEFLTVPLDDLLRKAARPVAPVALRERYPGEVA